MSRGVRLHRVAQRELDEATEYYDSEGPGLGFAFLDEVERALRQIRASRPSPSLRRGRGDGRAGGRGDPGDPGAG